MTSPGPEPPGGDARTIGLTATLGCAIMLLFPGGCLLLSAVGSGGDWKVLLTGIFILAVSGLLIWAAVRRLGA